MSKFTWNSNNIVWNNNPYKWNAVYEVIVETSSQQRGGMFYKKDRKYKNKEYETEEKQYIKILCIINDKEFESTKYINKKLKISSFDEELTIKEIKKVDISQDKIKFTMVVGSDEDFVLKSENKKIKINVKNIKKT